jgi:cytosine/adenosine deaminase-related metal-dependent hydrolase
MGGQRHLPAWTQREATSLHGEVWYDANTGNPVRHRLGGGADAVEGQRGFIAPGKYADIIAVPGDALGDLRSFMKVAFVMKGGTIYKTP